eukprot:CAMPEP_0118924502 /NCGR_PEP_ID=MMETSP1169-20130426/2610_1 /TAXON_ID=36882 /ORGANISM="Pyramimonas obovata, Strain CCMP722" /LENGTH=208 /DNA_ID=CAMNT_0006865623 /DNA_START=200 /DNA_END=822 /DNA_ORIENTATION=-
MGLHKTLSSDRLISKRSTDGIMKPYSAKILAKVASKDKVQEIRQGKISRRSQFSHVVPKKKESGIKGIWILWMMIGLMLVIAVLYPPQIKLVLFSPQYQYHYYNTSNPTKGDENAGKPLSLEPLRKLYNKQQDWVVLGLDNHLCKVLEVMEDEETPFVGIAPKTVTCGPHVPKLVVLRASGPAGAKESPEGTGKDTPEVTNSSVAESP